MQNVIKKRGLTVFAADLNERVFITAFFEQKAFVATAQHTLVFSNPVWRV